MAAGRANVLENSCAALAVFALSCCLPLGAVADRTRYVVHYMPWFAGERSGHWCNPDWGNSYYDSVLGQYDVADPFVHQRQLRLLKAAGIDGIWFDFQTPDWLASIQAIAEEALLLELNFAIVADNYLDENISNALQEDIRAFMKMPNYYRTDDGRPLLPLFEAPGRWQSRGTILPTWEFEGHTPFVIGTYHWHQRESEPLPQGYDSLFFWISNDVIWAERYHSSTRFSLKVGSVYRGWREAYKTWSHTPPYLGFLNRTLEIIKAQEPDFAQIVTWNDYTEGTMLEPSFIKGPGGCLEVDDTFWMRNEPCNKVRRFWGPCTPALWAPCAGSDELACTAIQDCTKPFAAAEGPGAAGCANVTYDGHSSTLSAYTDLATIAHAILGLPVEEAIATFKAIVEEDPPTTTTTTDPTPLFFEPEADGAGYACRGKSETDSSEEYFTLSFGVSTLLECQALCLQNSKCTGVEHSSSQGRCEVWTEPIGVKVAVSGFSCLSLRPSAEWPSSSTTATATTATATTETTSTPTTTTSTASSVTASTWTTATSTTLSSTTTSSTAPATSLLARTLSAATTTGTATTSTATSTTIRTTVTSSTSSATATSTSATASLTTATGTITSSFTTPSAMTPTPTATDERFLEEEEEPETSTTTTAVLSGLEATSTSTTTLTASTTQSSGVAPRNEPWTTTSNGAPVEVGATTTQPSGSQGGVGLPTTTVTSPEAAAARAATAQPSVMFKVVLLLCGAFGLGRSET